MENRVAEATKKTKKNASEISIIDFLFVTLFYCLYDICIPKSLHFYYCQHAVCHLESYVATGIRHAVKLVGVVVIVRTGVEREHTTQGFELGGREARS